MMDKRKRGIRSGPLDAIFDKMAKKTKQDAATELEHGATVSAIKELNDNQWTVVNVESDGNCMFNALALQLNQLCPNMAVQAQDVRSQVVEYIRRHPNIQQLQLQSQVSRPRPRPLNFDLEVSSRSKTVSEVLDSESMNEDELKAYLKDQSKPGTWGDGIMLSAAVQLYNRPVLIVMPDGQQQTIDTSTSCTGNMEPIRLGFINNNHYVSLSNTDIREGDFQHCTPLTNKEPISSVSEELEIQPVMPAGEREFERCNEQLAMKQRAAEERSTPKGNMESDDHDGVERNLDPSRPSTSHSFQLTTRSTCRNVDQPNHPPTDVFPVQKYGSKGKNLKFQSSWYHAYPWLHSETDVCGVLCFYCMKSYEASGTQAIAKNAEDAFVSTGFKNWKKAIDKFRAHESSHSHAAAVSQHLQAKSPVIAQVSTHHRQQQEKARNSVLAIVKCISFLARQGLALRGHEQGDGNFDQLVKFTANMDQDLQTWLARNQDYTSPAIQNEMLTLIANDMLRAVCKDIQKQHPAIFAVIVDGTRDITGTEQESFCVRYVSYDLYPEEVFLGLYAADCTTGQNIAAIIQDVLLRLQLPMSLLRGQTYDGAANMAGVHNGAQAVIRQKQPLALYVHCITHCVNLATEAAISESAVMRNAVSLVNELGVLSSQSGKFQTLFAGAASNLYDRVVKLRPLCPTRWTVRAKAIQHVLDQYEPILEALEEMAKSKGDAAARAAGLLAKFQEGNTYMSLVLAVDVISQLEVLNSSLQARKRTMSGMKVAVDQVLQSFELRRNDESHLKALQDQATEKCTQLDLTDSKVPRQRQPSKRYAGSAASFHPENVHQYFAVEYYKLIDTATSRVRETANQEGAVMFESLEACLLSGHVNDTCNNYPELDVDLLRIQLQMFRRQFAYNTVDEAANVMRSHTPEVRQLFSQVEVLIRLMLVIPVTSCEAERSFSSLRRLKTWLRSTMTQERLNNVALCNVHQEYLDRLDLPSIVNQFTASNERRMQLFGKF